MNGGPISNLYHQTKGLNRGNSFITRALGSDDIGLPGQGVLKPDVLDKKINYDPTNEYVVVGSRVVKLKEDHMDEEVAEVKEQTAWQKYKKAVILFLIAGPKASLIMAPIMIKKILAKYSITITGKMLATFAIELCMATGIYLWFKNSRVVEKKKGKLTML